LTFDKFENFLTSSKYIKKLWNAACGVDSEAVASDGEDDKKIDINPENK
jgi:hypothetical protein